MEAKHTPGPWLRMGRSIGVGAGEIATVWELPDGRAIANARLIAAAPGLLEACRAMIEWDDREQDHAVDFSARTELCRVAFDKARAAIAKATQ